MVFSISRDPLFWPLLSRYMAYSISCTAPNPQPNPFGIATKGSFPRRPKTNHDVPHKNTNKDKKNGMNSTLFVLITSLMIVKGEPYIMMEKTVAAIPQKSFLALPWRAKRETNTTVAKTASTIDSSPRILPFSFFGANMRKINT